MMARVGEEIAGLKSNPPPLPVQEIAEPSSSWNGSWPTTSPSSASATTNLRRQRHHRADLRDRPRQFCGRARRRRAALDQPMVITPEIRALLEEPTLLVVTNPPCARACTAHLHGLCRREALRCRRPSRRRVPHRRLFTRQPTPLDALDPFLRRKSTRCDVAARSDGTPARRWSMCWRTIRATSCSSSTRIRSITSRWRCCSSTSAAGCACCRGATASTASSPSWSMCRATATTAPCASASATISPTSTGHVSAFHPFFPEAARARHFIIDRNEGTSPIRIARSWSAPVVAIVRTWVDALGDELARITIRARRATCWRATATLSRRAIASLSPATALADIRVIEGCRRAAARRRLPAAPPTSACHRPEGVELDRPIARPSSCLCSRAWASKVVTSAPTEIARNAARSLLSHFRYAIAFGRHPGQASPAPPGSREPDPVPPRSERSKGGGYWISGTRGLKTARPE